MIRGILLLILSCVVLTLQQPCETCGSYATENVCDTAARYYSINDKDIDCTKKPDDAALLVSKIPLLSSSTLFKDNKPAKFEEYKAEGVAQRDACAQGAADYQSKKERIEKDIAEARKRIAVDRGNLDSFLEVIDSPLSAIDHCISLLRIRSSELRFVKVLTYLDISIRAKLDVLAGWDSYLNILETCLKLSIKIDNLLKNCLGLLCNVDSILKTLVDPLMTTFKAALKAFGPNIASIQAKVSAYINANLSVYVQLSPIDIIHNSLQVILNEKRRDLEKFQLISFVNIQANIAANIVQEPKNFLEVLAALSADFRLGPNPQVVCTGWNDPQAEEISITLTAKIIIDGNLDLNICAKKLVNIGRVATLAFSGSIHVDAKLLSVAGDGTAVIRIFINRIKIGILGIPYKIPEIVNVCGINSIVSSGQITQNLLEKLEECEVTPSSTLRPSLTNIIGNGIQNAGLDVVSIEAIIDAETALEAVRQISFGLITTSQDQKVLAQEARTICVAAITVHLENLRTVYPCYEQIKYQTEAKVASCQRDILQAKDDLSNNPDNVYIRDAYPICHPALVDSLKIQIGFQAQITRLCDSLQARIDIQAAFLIDLIDVLEKNVNDILTGIVKPISALRIHLQLNLQLIFSHIVSCITAIRPTCGIINVNLDLDASLNVITLRISIEEVLSIGDQIVDLRSCHQSIIKAAAIVCLGYPDVEVAVDVVNSGLSQHFYVVTIGKL